MSAMDILIIVGFFLAFGCLRFGVPLGVCWLIGLANRRFLHLES